MSYNEGLNSLTGTLAKRTDDLRLENELEAARARIAELQTENQRLREALQQIENEAAFPQEDYDRHGPSYTTPSGTEFVFAVHFLAKCNELAEVARKALEDGQ